MTNYRRLLATTIAAWLAGAGVVALCYRYVDREVAWFVHDHLITGHEVLPWLPLASEVVKYAALAAIAAVVGWWLWKPGGWLQRVLLALSASLLAATVLKTLLKWGFGRYWPETWNEGNPSLLGTDAYGFHPFHHGFAYESFPSGHAAVILAAAPVLWAAFPRWRWLIGAVVVGLCLALVGLNYHFVGDVIAGALVGLTSGVYAVRLFRIQPQS
jgi:membrane-associated phospholipid phosphatase